MTVEQRTAMAKQSAAAISQIPQQQFAASQKRSLQYMVSAPADVDAIAAAAAKTDPAATAQWVYEDLLLDLRPQLKNAGDGFGPAKIASAACGRPIGER